MHPAEKLLRELIALPSVNPALLPAGHLQAGEQRVADFLTATAASAGLDIELQPAVPGRSNLLARLTPSGKVRRRIILAPHMDTVPAFEEKQFVPTLKNGRIYGRGACDTKGSVAAMLTAVCELAKQKTRPQETEIVFAGLIDEEHGLEGSQALARSGLKADLAIVGEPTLNQVVTAHKGSLWLRFETHGKAAHGAKPELGENAIHEMARVVVALETEYAARLRKQRHPLLRHATVNVGQISGGKQPNVVPDFCEIVVDRRTLPGETAVGVIREIQALFKAKKIRAKIINTAGKPSLPMETSPSLPLVQQMLRTLGQKTALGVDYFCDASVLSRGGIPSVVFGPGDIGQAHTKDEWIAQRQLTDGTARLLAFLSAQP